MRRKTKIVCTIGPATDSFENMEGLFDEGMDVLRINCSHGNQEYRKKVIDQAKELRRKQKRPLSILLDTKGPEIRTGNMQTVHFQAQEVVTLVKESTGKEHEIPINPAHIVDEIQDGERILFNDGYVSGIVLDKSPGRVNVKMINSGEISKSKSISIPDQEFALPDVTEQDIEDIKFACKESVEIIAASFIGSAKQIIKIREILTQEGGSDILLFAKIETRKGVNNFEEILQVADGIMVARGDLGIEVFVAEVPPMQKKMVSLCNAAGKPVIIATQMLESMIQNPLPTRAEVSDVANAIYEATSCVMLSGETAIGSYPKEALRIMNHIILEAEADFNYLHFFYHNRMREGDDIPSAMARAAVTTVYDIQASALFVSSRSGYTVLEINRFRPNFPIISVTPDEKTFHKTGIMWGTEAILEKEPQMERDFQKLASIALQQGWVEYGDSVVLTTGTPHYVQFSTNTIMVSSIGNVLIRGKSLEDFSTCIVGEISKDQNNCKDKICIVQRLQKSDFLRIKEAKAILLDSPYFDQESEDALKDLYAEKKIPYMVQAKGAQSLLNSGETVQFYPDLGIVCKGDSWTKEKMLSFS